MGGKGGSGKGAAKEKTLLRETGHDQVGREGSEGRNIEREAERGEVMSSPMMPSRDRLVGFSSSVFLLSYHGSFFLPYLRGGGTLMAGRGRYKKR